MLIFMFSTKYQDKTNHSNNSMEKSSLQHSAPPVTAMLHHKVNKQTNHCHETYLGNQGFLAKDLCYCDVIAWQKSLQSCFTTTANKQTNITKIKELSCHSSLFAFQCFRIQLFWSKSGSRSRSFFISRSRFNTDPGDMEKNPNFWTAGQIFKLQKSKSLKTLPGIHWNYKINGSSYGSVIFWIWIRIQPKSLGSTDPDPDLDMKYWCLHRKYSSIKTLCGGPIFGQNFQISDWSFFQPKVPTLKGL